MQIIKVYSFAGQLFDAVTNSLAMVGLQLLFFIGKSENLRRTLPSNPCRVSFIRPLKGQPHVSFRSRRCHPHVSPRIGWAFEVGNGTHQCHPQKLMYARVGAVI